MTNLLRCLKIMNGVLHTPTKVKDWSKQLYITNKSKNNNQSSHHKEVTKCYPTNSAKSWLGYQSRNINLEMKMILLNLSKQKFEKSINFWNKILSYFNVCFQIVANNCLIHINRYLKVYMLFIIYHGCHRSSWDKFPDFLTKFSGLFYIKL